MDTAKDTVLITGGGTGLGRGLAEALHARGAKVIIAGRRADVLKKVAEANPGMAWYTLDVADPADITAFAAKLTAEHPDLNAVVSNAGIMKAEDLSSGTFDMAKMQEIVDINWWGTVRLADALLPHLLTRPKATFVTVSSGLAFVPLAFTPTYSATKAAIHSWTQSLRHQLRDSSVKVVEWAPPGVATDLMPGHAEDPASMPLDEFIGESVGLFEAGHDEVLVERVGFLRNAEARGDYAKTFGIVNSHHRPLD
ncbi:SDR family NAD(P)-dependent oxidoreductase [Brevundimonas sp. NIBR11]|uniref:SDR family oxidoreductase n=1 Tax=Brevundimonas sp. NIBR11 TaxID=3015999 RepID=UPI0022F0AE6D|nr:SDR family NAD(P)-dependent oxidoreductase [Brevundimonas sp. NIBR11]WGM30783.1 3-phenylpropionate-dihydrodiol/cinnamic acid-dihydrodiol dehydrogenase [Brevundimonas sp. NIBR11]